MMMRAERRQSWLGLASLLSMCLLWTSALAQGNTTFLYFTYHAGKKCGGGSRSSVLDVTQLPLNTCAIESVTSSFMYQCRQLGRYNVSSSGKFTVIKQLFPGSLNCSTAAANVSTAVVQHKHICRQDSELQGGFVRAHCGPLPTAALSLLDRLVTTSYPTSDCNPAGGSAITRITILGTCAPVFNREHQFIAYHRKLLADPSRSTPSLLALRAERYAATDGQCASRPLQQEQIAFFDFSAGTARTAACQPDPLYPFSDYRWTNAFALQRGPTSAPTPSPTRAPSPAPVTPAPTNPATTRGLVLALDAATFVSGATTWVDSVGSRAFTLYNSPVWSSAGGGSLAFVPASSQYAQSATALPSMSTWTVEVWHQWSGLYTGSYPALVADVYSGSVGRINYNLGAWGSASSIVMYWYGGGVSKETTGIALASGVWLHIVASFDGTTGNLYVNNVLKATANMAGAPSSSNAGIGLMGKFADTDFWGGSLAKVKIYNVGLTADEVNTNWLADRGRFPFFYSLNNGWSMTIANPNDNLVLAIVCKSSVAGAIAQVKWTNSPSSLPRPTTWGVWSSSNELLASGSTAGAVLSTTYSTGVNVLTLPTPVSIAANVNFKVGFLFQGMWAAYPALPASNGPFTVVSAAYAYSTTFTAPVGVQSAAHYGIDFGFESS